MWAKPRSAAAEILIDDLRSDWFFFNGNEHALTAGNYTAKTRRYFLAKRCDTVKTLDLPGEDNDVYAYDAISYKRGSCHVDLQLSVDDLVYRQVDTGRNL